jgi:hypothetical protein
MLIASGINITEKEEHFIRNQNMLKNVHQLFKQPCRVTRKRKRKIFEKKGRKTPL